MYFSCLLSALLFFVSNVMSYAAHRKWMEAFDRDKHGTLDTDYVQELWQFRRDNNSLFLSNGIINGLAWFFFTFPMLHLLWILSQQQQQQQRFNNNNDNAAGDNDVDMTKAIEKSNSSSSPSTGWYIFIALLLFTGCFTEWTVHFLYMGSSSASNYISKEFILSNWINVHNTNDQIGWRVLEVVHIVTRGFLHWLDTFEWFVLFLTMICLYIVVHKSASNTTIFINAWVWKNVGLAVAFFSLLDFITQVLRFDGYRIAGQISFWYSIFNRLLLLPMWLILLARLLPIAILQQQQRQQQSRQNNNNVQEFEMMETTSPAFTSQVQRPGEMTI